MTSETWAALTPLASSKDATKSVPAAKGRKVIAAPVREVLFQSDSGISIDMGVPLKGTTVKAKGREEGSLPPAKDTVKLPHCRTGEKEMVSK